MAAVATLGLALAGEAGLRMTQEYLTTEPSKKISNYLAYCDIIVIL